jgi:hypothetical protein
MFAFLSIDLDVEINGQESLIARILLSSLPYNFLFVLTTRMQSIDYPNNYSLKNSIADIFRGRTPVFTLFLCGYLFNLIYSYGLFYSINSYLKFNLLSIEIPY